MNVTKILEILIALAVIYYLFSTLVSVIFEWYSFKTQKRGKFLYETIVKLLADNVNQSYGATMYAHHSIESLKKNKNSYPQYISSDMFADTLIDIIGTQSETIQFVTSFDEDHNLKKVELVEKRIDDPFGRFVAGVNQMNYSPLKSHLRSFHEKARSYEKASINAIESTNEMASNYEKAKSYAQLKTLLSTWYDDYMERVTGWYKVGTKSTLLVISLLVSLSFNVDSIRLIKKLNVDDDLRKNLVVQAEQTVLNKNAGINLPDSGEHFESDNELIQIAKEKKLLTDSMDRVFLNRCDSIIAEIDNKSLPIGYHGDIEETHGSWYFLVWLCGILISSYALSLGAPFWFDLMSKAINIRRAGIKPEKSND